MFEFTRVAKIATNLSGLNRLLNYSNKKIADIPIFLSETSLEHLQMHSER